MSKEPQNLKNHGRLDPPFHFVPRLDSDCQPGLRDRLPGITIVNFYSRVAGGRCRSLRSSLLFTAAPYPLKVQDRVIRLEERLRLQALAPAEWHAQIYRLTEDQLIGLRFAADDEVVELAKQALEHNLNRKQIKERIKDWRADDWRV